jgi:hypothetical protein
MKNIFKTLIVFLIIVITFDQCKSNNPNGIIVSGNIENSNQDYVILGYFPRYRGNPSFDGFKNKGAQIDNNGKFNLVSEKATDGGNYSLLFRNTSIMLPLFKGDNIEVNFDINKPNETLFVTGQGAGKINILNLEQFKSKFFSDLNYTIEEYKKYLDSIAFVQQSLLNSVYKKYLKNEVVISAKNRNEIKQIINENNLSQKEFDFISLKIYLQKLSLSSYISYLSEINKQDSIKLDFKSNLFDDFNEENYKKITNLNDWKINDALENILIFEYLKSIQNSGESINMKNYNNFLQGKEYAKWKTDYIKQTFNSEVFDMTMAGPLAFDMSLGYGYDKTYDNFIKNCTNKKYLDWINNFKNLLDNGLNNSDYNLSSEELTLDKTKFEKLVVDNTDKPIFFVFWSARHAGASVIQDLPALNDFNDVYGNNINVINICLDKAIHKNLWVARIIDSSWKGKHYFMPFENNNSTLNAFTNKDISSLCSGGVTYAIMNFDGKIINNIDSPLRFLNRETDEFLEKTIH